MPEQKQPNIIFLFADQHRWDFMGYESNGVTHTPNLDKLAERGVLFRSAYCNAPLCSPSRQCIASGQYGSNSGSFTNLHKLPAGTPSFVSQLRNNGYRTCAIGKTHMEIHAYDSNLTTPEHAAYMDSLGWDEICELGGNSIIRAGVKCHYSEYLKEIGAFDDVIDVHCNYYYFMDPEPLGDHCFQVNEWPLDEGLTESGFIGQRSIDWIKKQDKETPYFLHVGFTGPHSPTMPTPTFMDMYRDSEEAPPWDAKESPEWLAEGRRGYRASITEIDAWVGKIIDEVEARGELDNTIFAYTADHGEMAGDHDRFDKTTFFDPSVRVPFIFAGPGIEGGQDSDALVELIDVGKTFCDLAGVVPHAKDQGKSLVPVLSGESQSHRDTVYVEMGCDKMLFDGRHKLMWGEPTDDTRKLGRLHLDKPINIAPSPRRLYDMEADPHEINDLTGDRELMATMMEKLLIRLNENTQPLPNLDRGEYKPVRPQKSKPDKGTRS
jgi:arylsulfatase A-like enzyme